MSTEVVDVLKVSSADDLADLLNTLRAVMTDAGLGPNDMDTVLPVAQVSVRILRNRLTDGSHTIDLDFRVQDVE